MFDQLVISGLASGSLYALTAVAVVVVFRNTRTINLAQGDFAMIGAFMALIFLKDFGLNYYISLGLAVIFCIGLGILVERLVMRPLADSDWLTLFTATLGVYYILHGVAGWFWGRDTKAFPVTFDPTPVHVFGTIISEGHLINMAWVTGIGIVLYVFFKYTKQGIAMRAVTDDPETAELMGIPVNRMISLTFFIGAALGGAAGVLYSLYYGSIKYNMGFVPGMKAFTAAVLGGIGNIPGAMLGGLLLGISESLGVAFLPEAEWKVPLEMESGKVCMCKVIHFIFERFVGGCGTCGNYNSARVEG